MGIKSRVGDVFLVPLGQGESVLGQIIDKYKGALYVFVFDKRAPDRDHKVNIDSIGQPIFAALTLDALLFHGRWPIIGNLKVDLERELKPKYKIGSHGNCYVENFKGDPLRPATAQEEHDLRFRTIYAPIRLDKATKAYFGCEDWDLAYDDLKYEYVERTSAM